MFTWYCDYVFLGYYVLLGIVTTFSQVTMFTWYCDYVFSGYYVLLGIVTTFSQVVMFYLVL